MSPQHHRSLSMQKLKRIEQKESTSLEKRKNQLQVTIFNLGKCKQICIL
jgi:hypothetical protein